MRIEPDAARGADCTCAVNPRANLPGTAYIRRHGRTWAWSPDPRRSGESIRSYLGRWHPKLSRSQQRRLRDTVCTVEKFQLGVQNALSISKLIGRLVAELA